MVINSVLYIPVVVVVGVVAVVDAATNKQYVFT